jgi:hypothetical protein
VGVDSVGVAQQRRRSVQTQAQQQQRQQQLLQQQGPEHLTCFQQLNGSNLSCCCCCCCCYGCMPQGASMMDGSAVLKPALSRGTLRCIGASTLDKFKKTIEKDPGLERCFQQVLVEPTNIPDTISILRGLRQRYEAYHGMQISEGALMAAATLSQRYISGRHLPDKAIDCLDEAAAQVGSVSCLCCVWGVGANGWGRTGGVWQLQLQANLSAGAPCVTCVSVLRYLLSLAAPPVCFMTIPHTTHITPSPIL